MESLKKYFKLLCCVFITLFMFGIGGEKVSAEPQKLTVQVPGNTVQEQSWYFEWVPSGGYQNSLIKRDQEGNYVFCMDSNQKLYRGEMDLVDSLVGYQEGFKDKISKIVANAYRLGLDDGNATHIVPTEFGDVTISEKDFYGVTQVAIWSAAHGLKADGGYTQKYQTWVESRGYKGVFTELMKEYDGYFDLVFDEKAQEADDTYYYSDKFSLKRGGVPSTVQIKLVAPEISSDRDDVEIKIGNGDWKILNSSHPHDINAGDTVVARAKKPSPGNSSRYRYSITTGSYYDHSDVFFYSSPEGFQNIVLAIKKDVTYTKINNFSYTNTTVEKKTIKIEKKSGNKYVGDATLRLYIPQSSNDDVEDVIISDFITPRSTDENPTPNVSYSVEVGKRYCVKEISAPYGYLLSNDHVCVDVTSESTEQDLTLNVQNERLKVKFRKIDANGNPIEGVKIKIVNYVHNQVAQHFDDVYICAITDSQGYLTKPCESGGSISDYYAGNGEFYYEPSGDSDNRAGNMYYIQEEFKDGYYVRAFDPNDELHATTQDFYISDKVFFTEYSATNYIRLSGNLGSSTAPTINIINDKYLKFSKVDTGTGAEVPGAEMTLYDASVIDTGLSEEPLFVLVDEWTSTDKPHAFTGIVPGHEYVLSEVVAPDKYVKLSTDIRFKMDSDGNIEVLTVDQNLVKPKDDARNWLIVGNNAAPKIIDVPNTGISLLNKIAIGGLMVFVGYEAIKIYRKRTA